MFFSSFRVSTIVVFSSILLSGCGALNFLKQDQETKVEYIPIPDIGDYKDIRAIPNPKLRQAAAAVVKILTSNASGTGFFIHKEGILATNEHVIGRENCMREGCVGTLIFEMEAGFKKSKDVDVFFEPLRVNAKKDISIFRVYELTEDFKKGPVLKVPANLSIKFEEGSKLVGKNLSWIGHPQGSIKKIKTAKAVRMQSGYVVLPKLTIGGNSGSPILNEDGEAVGILHSGTDSSRNISAQGLRDETHFSSLKDAFLALEIDEGEVKNLANVKPSALGNLPTLITDSTQKGYDYLHYITNPLDGKTDFKSSIFLGQQKTFFDTSLAKCEATATDLEASEQTYMRTRHVFSKCSDFFELVNCKTSGLMQKNQARFCPTEKQLAGGQNAILKIVDSLADEHLEVDAVHVLFSSELFSPHDSGQRMRSILAKNKRSLSIEVAYYWILSYAIESNNSQPVYEGQNTWDYIKDYAQHFSGISAYSQVVRAFVIALHQGKISKDNFQATITSILANPTVTISEKLTIEQTLFSEGML